MIGFGWQILRLTESFTTTTFLYLANQGQILPSLKRTEIGLRQEPARELTEVNMCGVALEFKLDIAHNPQRVYPQAFADMVRVANDLIIDVLSVGKVVDEVSY